MGHHIKRVDEGGLEAEEKDSGLLNVPELVDLSIDKATATKTDETEFELVLPEQPETEAHCFLSKAKSTPKKPLKKTTTNLQRRKILLVKVLKRKKLHLRSF